MLKLKLQYFGHLICRVNSLKRNLRLGKIEGRRRGATKIETSTHWNEFEQTPGDGKRQGSLACCSPWGRKESDTTKRLNNSNCPFFMGYNLWR